MLLKSGRAEVIKMAATLKTYRDLLLMCYEFEVKRGLKKIEDLDPEFKNQIWQETKKDTVGLSKDQCIEMVKIVYLISSKI